MEAETGLSYDLKEARNLLRDYRAALPRCENGSLLKEELAKLNLRAFAMGLALPPDSVLSERFQQVIALTSVRREQGGIFAHMDEARNVRHWVDFLCELADPSPEMLAAAPASRPHFIL